MGQFTTNGQIWYPDTADTAELNTLLATMASSLEDGLTPRLAHQELARGLKASVPDATFSLPAIGETTIPYTVTAGNGDFNNGFTLAGGIATVGTAGMYLLTASIGAETGTGTGLKIHLYKNAILTAIAEVPQSGSVWVNAQATCVVNCVAGDTLQAKGKWTSGSGSVTLKQNATNYISIAMVQATPL